LPRRARRGDPPAGVGSLPRLSHRRLPDRGARGGREAEVRAGARVAAASGRRSLARWATVHLFHYHLVTSRVREVEARYVGKLAFGLVARHGRIGEDLTSYEPGVSWSELDAMGFKLRLTELE